MLRRRPSPALVIACLALFVSLGGVSYGVATGSIDSREIRNNSVKSADVRNNSLGTNDIRNNAIRGFDIHNSTIQGRDVALNTLTGADVDESQLAQVPSAAQADTATTVTSLKRIGPASLAAGGRASTLVANGPLTLTARCDDVGGDVHARVFAQTTEAASSAGAQTDVPTLSPGIATQIADLTDSPGGARAVDETGMFASAPSGKGVTGQLMLLADAGGSGGCAFQGYAVLHG